MYYLERKSFVLVFGEMEKEAAVKKFMCSARREEVTEHSQNVFIRDKNTTR
jgi:hypothetical protein